MQKGEFKLETHGDERGSLKNHKPLIKFSFGRLTFDPGSIVNFAISRSME